MLFSKANQFVKEDGAFDRLIAINQCAVCGPPVIQRSLYEGKNGGNATAGSQKEELLISITIVRQGEIACWPDSVQCITYSNLIEEISGIFAICNSPDSDC